jgi:hypothetical protein
MLLVLADPRHSSVPALLERWAGTDVAVLTCADLSQVGWQLGVGVSAGCAAVAGKRITFERITGVLNRLSGVTPHDLPHIARVDRAYVAAEMTAFLSAWLHALPCPVLNRPGPSCLMGPSYRPAWWLRAAAAAGLPVRPMRHCIKLRAEEPALPAPRTSVTVVGQKAHGDADPALLEAACRLAAATGVGLLQVHFSHGEAGAEVLGADLSPDLLAPGIAEAVLGYFKGGSA